MKQLSGLVGVSTMTILLGALLLFKVKATPVYPLPLPHFNYTAGVGGSNDGLEPSSGSLPGGGGGGGTAGYVWMSRKTYETFDKDCVLTKDRPVPVVMLPGLLLPLVTTRYMAHRLQDAGYCVYQLEYGLGLMDTLNGIGDIRESAEELASFVKKVLSITGASQVDLIGYSEGTLVSLWYLRKLGGEKNIRTLTAIAPLFHGTTIRGLTTILKGLNFYDTIATLTDLICPACTQIVEGSPFLQELWTKEIQPAVVKPAPEPRSPVEGGVKYLVVMSAKDEVVTPWTSGYLDDVDGGEEEGRVKHVVVEDVCEYGAGGPIRHLGMMFSPLVFAVVDGFLTPESDRGSLDCQST